MWGYKWAWESWLGAWNYPFWAWYDWIIFIIGHSLYFGFFLYLGLKTPVVYQKAWNAITERVNRPKNKY